MSDTATARQERVFNGALALLLHRNGPNADVSAGEIALCADLASKLEAQVESALGVPQPF